MKKIFSLPIWVEGNPGFPGLLSQHSILVEEGTTIKDLRRKLNTNKILQRIHIEDVIKDDKKINGKEIITPGMWLLINGYPSREAYCEYLAHLQEKTENEKIAGTPYLIPKGKTELYKKLYKKLLDNLVNDLYA